MFPSCPPQTWPGDTCECLHIWFLRSDEGLAATLSDYGYSGQIAVPLAAVARTLAHTEAAYLFIAHSHPSGDPRPSLADIDATRQLWRLARTLGASLQDHLVIGRRRVFSFRSGGLL